MKNRFITVIAISVTAMLAAASCGSKNVKQDTMPAETVVATETEASTATKTQTQQETEVPETETETQSETEVETQPETETTAVSDDEIRPEFQKAMDEYVEFFEGYCEFMKNYDASDVSSLAKYAEFLAQYQETMEALEDINEEELTDAEAKLYTQTMLKIDQMLVDVM